MNNCAILTLCDDITRKLFEKSTFPYIQAYCDKICADFLIYGEDEDCKNWLKTKYNIKIWIITLNN